jgi:hypothetical protein
MMRAWALHNISSTSRAGRLHSGSEATRSLVRMLIVGPQGAMASKWRYMILGYAKEHNT